MSWLQYLPVLITRSYTMQGKLAKAPGFKDQETFKPEDNGLFEIRTHIDQLGYLYINMDTYVQRPSLSCKHSHWTFTGRKIISSGTSSSGTWTRSPECTASQSTSTNTRSAGHLKTVSSSWVRFAPTHSLTDVHHKVITTGRLLSTT